jgi:hypothetical protein
MQERWRIFNLRRSILLLGQLRDSSASPVFGMNRRTYWPEDQSRHGRKGNIPAPAANQTSFLQLIVFIDWAIPTPQNPTERSDIQTHHKEQKNTQLDVWCAKACTIQSPLGCKKNSSVPHLYSWSKVCYKYIMLQLVILYSHLQNLLPAFSTLWSKKFVQSLRAFIPNHTESYSRLNHNHSWDTQTDNVLATVISISN